MKKELQTIWASLNTRNPPPTPCPPLWAMPIWKQHISKRGFPYAVTLANIQYSWMLSPPVSQVRSLIIVHEIWTIFIAEFCAWKLWCNLHLVTLLWFLPAAEHLASLVNCSNEYEAVGGGGGVAHLPPRSIFREGRLEMTIAIAEAAILNISPFL